uniref:EOG090X0BKO n=1 Tax=Lynceus sp. MCZ IZ 141354 TaxID=1930659 RepID=A0A9N6ZG00_9CRUS|nr:EOG090X0BKO [Lynceus sp. MCZ IZ 141354]
MNLILTTQITGYVVALVLSLCVTVPLSVHMSNFGGRCLLFSRGSWRETDGQFEVTWTSRGYCIFSIFVGVLLFVTSLVQLYRLAFFLLKGLDSSFLSAFVDSVTSTLFSILTLVAALFITLGFGIWCQDITQRFQECSYAEDKDIDKIDNIDTSGFYTLLGTAQFGAWASWACWVGLSVCAILKICRYHQQENVRVSMARERKRLVNDGLHPSQESRTELLTD